MGLSKYPTQLDDATSSPIATDLVTPVAAAIFNRVRAATLAAQAELGTNPSGVYGTVRARLDAISAAINTINATGIVHAIAHGQGGVDEITVQNLGSDSAAAGWLLAADGVGGLAFTTNLHAPSHSAGGSDEITVQDLGSALATDGYVLTADGFGALTFESTLHAPSHSAGGSDEITVQDLGSALATDGYVLTADGFGALTFESSLHASSHNAGGSDEITAQDLGSDSALDGYLMVADGLGGWDATLLLDKSVDPFANIQGIKIDPDFGSQDVITTGGIIANQIALGGKSLPGATFGIALPNSQGVVIDNAGGVGRDVLRMNGATDTIEIGQNTSTVQIHASGAGLLTLVGGVQRAQLTTAAHILSMAGRQWASTVVSPSITQLIDTGIASTGDTLTISAQQCSGGASTGGGLVLKPGDGTAASGSLKLQHGDTTTIVELTAAKTVLISGDTTVTGKVSASTYMAIGATPATTGDIRLPHQFTIYTRDSTGTNRILSSQDAVNNMYFGNGSATTQIGGGGAGGRVVVASAFVSLAVPLYFVSAVVAPTIYQATDTTIGVTGDTFSLHAQDVNSAGAASTGGNLLIRAGNGLGVADIAGNLQLSGGTDVGGGIGTVSITGNTTVTGTLAATTKMTAPYMAVGGGTEAVTGGLRLANGVNGSIYAKGSGITEVQVVYVDGSNNLFWGENSATVGNMYFDTSVGKTIYLRSNYVAIQTIQTNGVAIGAIPASWQGGYKTLFFSDTATAPSTWLAAGSAVYSVSGTLVVKAGFKVDGATYVTPIDISAANYVVLATDNYLRPDGYGAGAPINIDLPEITAANDGREIRFKDQGSAAAFNVTFTANVGAGDTIEGAATLVLSTNGAGGSLVANFTRGDWELQ